MVFTLEALQANDGDCLILHYQKTAAGDAGARADRRRIGGRLLDVLKPRLDQLRGEEAAATCGW